MAKNDGTASPEMEPGLRQEKPKRLADPGLAGQGQEQVGLEGGSVGGPWGHSTTLSPIAVHGQGDHQAL